MIWRFPHLPLRMDLFDFTPASRRKSREDKEKDAAQVESVTQLTRRIRDLLEDGIGAVWVEGEVSNHRKQASGHHYFTLKDGGAQLACVLFKGNAAGVGARLGDGLAVQVFGEVSVYEARGQYQMIVRQVRQAGVGALQARFEALKRRLMEEGLFEQDRKQPIPRFPLTVAIVTSPTGAALQDMLNILRRRAPWLRVLVCPVRVQGAGAAEEIAAALRFLSNEPAGLPHIDTVVVARGGGSLEDLWAFNEEVVARAMADCPLPLISAVGHEIDFTIADFVADLRAPTPSAAAELLAPDGAELRAMLERQGSRMQRRVESLLMSWRRELDLMSRGALSRGGERVLLPWRQQVDDLAEELQTAVADEMRTQRQRLLTLAHQLERARPDRVMMERRAELALRRERLESRVLAALTSRRNQVDQNRRQLQALGPEAVLARGFSYTLNASGKVVREARELKPGEEFTTQLGIGRVRGVVKAVE
jgi:exodeoxyribonuclease VII large subunit